MGNLPYLLALHRVEGLGPVRLRALLDYFKDPKLAWGASERSLKEIKLPQNVTSNLLDLRKNFSPQEYFENITKQGIKILSFFDEDYPQKLKEIYDPPLILFFKGEMPSDYSRTIGVVGTRKVTSYGRIVTEKFTKDLSLAGFIIVSGLASGVDSIAHQTAVNSNGKTVAVLGGGINQIFPPQNIKLAEKISNGFGAVISEFPPDHPSLPGNFPARNRIISGLSLGVLVTEAAEDSGSLITARLALEQGREVFAIPGPVTSFLSKGPADLIKEGAKLVFETKDIVDESGTEGKLSPKLLVEVQENLSEEERVVLKSLDSESKHIDELCRQLQKPSSEISANLIKMEIKGLVKNLGGGVYSKSY